MYLLYAHCNHVVIAVVVLALTRSQVLGHRTTITNPQGTNFREFFVAQAGAHHENGGSALSLSPLSVHNQYEGLSERVDVVSCMLQGMAMNYLEINIINNNYAKPIIRLAEY